MEDFVFLKLFLLANLILKKRAVCFLFFCDSDHTDARVWKSGHGIVPKSGLQLRKHEPREYKFCGTRKTNRHALRLFTQLAVTDTEPRWT